VRIRVRSTLAAVVITAMVVAAAPGTATGTLTLSLLQYLAHGRNASSADSLRISIVHSGGTTAVFTRTGAAADLDAVWATTSASLNPVRRSVHPHPHRGGRRIRASLVEAAVDNVTITRS
jgi:carboxypeptidase T